MAAVLFMLAAAWAAWFVTYGDVQASFYQHEFSPAVSIACGHGYEDRGIGDHSKALYSFLEGKSESFDCARLSGSPRPTNAFQNVHLYLIGAVGLMWKLFGISWSSILPLYALLCGMTAIATYGLLRLCSGRLVSAGATLLLAVSALNSTTLPHLRDYSKAPFVLVVVLIMLWVVILQVKPSRTLLLSALAGLLVGVGVGFRMDLIVFVPAFAATVLVFLPGGVRANLPVKLASCGLFAAVFLATAWPVLKGIGGGGNAYHVILLGLMSPFDSHLGVIGSVYEWGSEYNDAYVSELVSSYARRVLGAVYPLQLGTVEYDRAGLSYLATLASSYPADLLTRYLAAVVKVLQSASPGLLFGSFAGYFAVLMPVAILTPWLAGFSIAIVAAKEFRLAIFCLALVLFLCGYPSLQFQGRHYFHLQVVPVWFLLFIAYKTVGPLVHRLRSAPRSAPAVDWSGVRSQALRGAVFLGATAFLLLGGLWALRNWQQAHLIEKFREYERAPSVPAPFLSVDEVGEDFRVLRPNGHSGSDETSLSATNYWIADFDASRCGLDVIDFLIAYEASNPYFDASRVFSLRIAPKARYYFATYTFDLDGKKGGAYRHLRGVSVPREASACLAGVREVTDRSHLDLLPSLLLREGWEEERLYQRIGPEDGNGPALRQLPALVKHPDGNWITRQELAEMISRANALPLASSYFRSPIVSLQGDGFEARGSVAQPYSYLIQMPAKKLSRPALLVAEGENFSGGLTIGLVQHDRWAGQANITRPGPFRVVLRAEPGEYQLTIANNLSGGYLNHVRIQKVGWIEP